MKSIGLAYTCVLLLIVCGLIFRSYLLRPCAVARTIFEGYDSVSGYGTFQGMLTGNFRYLGGRDFVYIESNARSSLNRKEPRATFVHASAGIFGVSEILTMSVPVSEFYSSKGRPLACSGDPVSPFLPPTPASPQSTS
jgi:Na+/proline symporter